MPGVLMVEALAQTGAVAILSLEENKGKIAYFGGIENANSKEKLFRGINFVWKQRSSNKGPVGVGEAVATVDGKK